MTASLSCRNESEVERLIQDSERELKLPLYAYINSAGIVGVHLLLPHNQYIFLLGALDIKELHLLGY